MDFSILTDEKSVLRQTKTWRKAIAQLEAKEMPPEEATPLPPEQRERLVRWMKHTVDAVVFTKFADRDPGPALIRRLSRYEYNLTVRDLIGFDFDAGEAVGLPDDGGAQSFSNLAAALNFSSSHLEKYFAAADKILERLFNPPPPNQDANAKRQTKQAYDALFFVKPGNGLSERDAARKIVARFAGRAYRRPAREAEIERLLKFYDRARGAGVPPASADGFAQAVRAMLKPVLVSPNFLFRLEEERGGANAPRTATVNGFELASRLSYFLWSTMPDEELFTLAGQSALADPAVLEKQVRRMLADPRARTLTDNFAMQWLQIRKLADARPSTEYFPNFTQKLRKAMQDEIATFVDKLRQEDRSILELIDCDYTYVNQDLAAHYKIPGVNGAEMRRVSFKPEENYHRGGLLGMGSILAMTSHTNRTSPTLRGKYILEVIFGTPPPPPPANAGILKEEKDKSKAPKTFRDQMAQHATDQTCAACHKKMDPLGFALDNFDAVGGWRDNHAGQALDTSGQLPTGEKFNGPQELKQLLGKRQEQFVRNLTQQMLTYALGRELDYYDECSIQDIAAPLEKNQHRFSVLVLEIAKSFPFQHRRIGDSIPEETK